MIQGRSSETIETGEIWFGMADQYGRDVRLVVWRDEAKRWPANVLGGELRQ